MGASCVYSSSVLSMCSSSVLSVCSSSVLSVCRKSVLSVCSSSKSTGWKLFEEMDSEKVRGGDAAVLYTWTLAKL